MGKKRNEYAFDCKTFEDYDGVIKLTSKKVKKSDLGRKIMFVLAGVAGFVFLGTLSAIVREYPYEGLGAVAAGSFLATIGFTAGGIVYKKKYTSAKAKEIMAKRMQREVKRNIVQKSEPENE